MLERRLIIVGDGETRADDFALANRSKKYREIMLINKVITHHEKEWHHWVSYHPEVFMMVTHWRGLTHSNLTNGFRPSCLWKHENKGGTSALFALETAKRLGYNKIVICGCPLSGNYGGESVVSPWKIFVGKNQDWCKNSVRSYSGKTKELFGDSKGWW
jgi:hypothetical protein